jgi:hypothetical protein
MAQGTLEPRAERPQEGFQLLPIDFNRRYAHRFSLSYASAPYRAWQVGFHYRSKVPQTIRFVPSIN